VVRWLDSAPSSQSSSPPIPIKRLPLPLVSGDVLESADSHRAGPSLDLSPDGTKLVYVARRNGRTRLMLRSLDRLEPVELPGTEDAGTRSFTGW
jgi:Tol biopolymer transport system component